MANQQQIFQNEYACHILTPNNNTQTFQGSIRSVSTSPLIQTTTNEFLVNDGKQFIDNVNNIRVIYSNTSIRVELNGQVVHQMSNNNNSSILKNIYITLINQMTFGLELYLLNQFGNPFTIQLEKYYEGLSAVCDQEFKFSFKKKINKVPTTLEFP